MIASMPAAPMWAVAIAMPHCPRHQEENMRFSSLLAWLIALFVVAGPILAADRFPHKQCALDTTKVESAMESAAELSALNQRVEDAFDCLQSLSRGLDERSHRIGFRADWL